MAEISSTGDQMLQLLELVAFTEPKTTAELAQASGINRTVAHRLLATLHNRGYVARQGKVFVLGPVMAQIAGLGQMSGILEAARPVMRELADETGESVVLHRMDGDMAVVVDQAVNESQLVRVQHREGSRHSLALGASGRAILAFQSDAVQRRFVVASPDPDSLKAKLAEVRARGFALSRNELQTGVVGAAVPLQEQGNIQYSLAILVPIQRGEGVEHHIPALTAARRKIESAAASSQGEKGMRDR